VSILSLENCVIVLERLQIHPFQAKLCSYTMNTKLISSKINCAIALGRLSSSHPWKVVLLLT